MIGRIARYLAALIVVVFALLLRVALERKSVTLPTYVTFYPVVFLAALFGDMWAGILATTLSALMADYFLLAPVGQVTVHSTPDIFGLAIFFLSGVSISIVTELYHRSLEKRETHRIEALILNERRNVTEARELAGTVLEERLRFLDALETLRTIRIPTGLPEAVQIGRQLTAAGPESRLPGLDRKEFRSSLRRTVMVPFLAALILAGAALWAANDLNSSLRWVDHTNQVIGQSRRLLKLTLDMETGERGYLVTGNEVFLQPYQEASRVLDSEYRKLYLLVADDPPQQAQLERLHDDLQHWQGYAEQMIALRRAGGAYTDFSINLAGKGEVDEIRDQIAGFQSVEEHRRDERNRTAHRDWRLAATICILLGLGVGSGLAIFTFRRMETITGSFEESSRALADSERRWATILASIGDAVMAAGKDGRVTFLNPVAAALTGWRPEDAIGQPIQNVFQIVNEETRVPAEDIVNRVLKDGRVSELANHTVLMARDGREISIADSAAPIFEVDGAIVGVVLVFRDVTEQSRIEEAVRESEAKLQAALASMTDSVIITDAEGRFVEFNDSYAAFYKFKSKAECARSFDEFASLFEVFMADGERAPREMYAIQRALRGETATNAEYSVRRKDTGESWIGSLSFGPIRDQDGAITGSVVTARDVTEAKRAEEALQRSETEFRNLANAIPQLCWMADADGRVFWYNERWYEYTGTIAEMMEGRGWQSVHDQNALPLVLERWKASIATGNPFDMVFPLRGADGIFRQFLTRVMPVRDSDGKATRWFGTNTDISEQKQIEEELRKSRERLNLAFEVANLGEWERDLESHTTTRSLRHAQVFGYSSTESEWNFERFLAHVLPERRAEVIEALKPSQTGGTTDFETQIRRVDDEVRWIWMRSHTEPDEMGRPSQEFGIVMDITERKEAEEALLRSERDAFQRQQLHALAAHLQQVREDERKMVARDLHDQIGQILTAIKMDLTWALRRLTPSNGEVHDRLDGSIKLINEGVHSVRKICSGLRPGILDDLGLAAAIEWQAKEFGTRTGISCGVTFPPGELRPDGDRDTAIFRIFQECLTNVARHAEAQSVRTCLYEQDENLMLVVADDGKGFSESEVAGSLGVLGMKERAQACGGSVKVSSALRRGTTVTVRIPLHASVAEQEDYAHSDSR